MAAIAGSSVGKSPSQGHQMESLEFTEIMLSRNPRAQDYNWDEEPLGSSYLFLHPDKARPT